MNLNYDTSQHALMALISQADQSVESHTIAIDYDGEVLIDPEIHYPAVDIARYKFCTHVKDASLRNDYMIHALYKALFSIYEREMLLIGYEGELNIAA